MEAALRYEELMVEEEKEMDRIRLTVLENDMRRVKDKVGIA